MILYIYIFDSGKKPSNTKRPAEALFIQLLDHTLLPFTLERAEMYLSLQNLSAILN